MRRAERGRGLVGQRAAEPVEQERDVVVGAGAPHQAQLTAVGGGDDRVEKLHPGEFLEDDPWPLAGGHGSQLLLAQGDGQAIGQEGVEDGASMRSVL